MAHAWREGRREDYPALKHFACARKQKNGRRTVYPYRWEQQAQSAIRTHRKPLCDSRSAVLVAENESGQLVAVVSVKLEDLPLGAYLIEVIAVRLDMKGQRVGDSAMDTAIEWITNHADINGVKDVSVLADCHPLNKRAVKMLRRYGFERFSREATRDEWLYQFSLG